MYPADLVMPMKAELTDKGFKTLPQQNKLTMYLNKGTTLVVVNSVCGCGRAARPGVIYSLTGDKTRPFNYCFAGFDTEAVAEARKHFAPFHQVHLVLHFSKMENWFTC